VGLFEQIANNFDLERELEEMREEKRSKRE
jgi:hypothetical protein